MPDPLVVCKGVVDSPLLPLGGLEKIGRTFGGSPSSQEEDQKDAFRPSLLVTLVAALNNCLSERSFGVSEPTQVLGKPIRAIANTDGALWRIFPGRGSPAPPLLWATDLVPADLAFAVGHSVAAMPQHASTELVKGLEGTLVSFDGRQQKKGQ